MISKTVQPYLFRFSGFGLGIDFTDVFYNYVVVVDLKIFYAENFLLFASPVRHIVQLLQFFIKGVGQ